MACENFCDIPAALKSVWCEDEALSYGIQACGSTETSFFDEGISISDAPLPYVVLQQGTPLEPRRLGTDAVLDTRPYILKIYGTSRRFLNEMSRAAREAYTSTGCIDTEEGSVCSIRFSAANHVLFADGTRVNIHRLNLMVIDKLN